MENIVIDDLENIELKKQKFLKDGSLMIHVLADFENTLTKGIRNGEQAESIFSLLCSYGFLDKEYIRESNEIYEFYRPIEMNPRIEIDVKKQKIEEWWRKHYNLLIKYGLNFRHLKKIVDDEKILFRDGFGDFLDLLNKKNIPLVIISSSGIGEIILLMLKKFGKDYGNIFVMSNFFEWDSRGFAIGVKEPIISSWNKNEFTLKSMPVAVELKNRRNVLLLGDNIGDLEMIRGFEYESLLSIGFLNLNTGSHLIYFKEKFDVVITGDGTFEYVNRFFRFF